MTQLSVIVNWYIEYHPERALVTRGTEMNAAKHFKQVTPLLECLGVSFKPCSHLGNKNRRSYKKLTIQGKDKGNTKCAMKWGLQTTFSLTLIRCFDSTNTTARGGGRGVLS